jgi:hypothetical protein
VSRRRAAVLAAVVAMLSAAPAAPAATLDVPLPLGSGQEETSGIGAHVDTPVASVDLRASSGRVSTSITAPPPQIEIPPPASTAEPSLPGASKSPPSRAKADRLAARRNHQQKPVRSSASDRPVPPDPPSGRISAAPAEEVGGLPSPSFLPEASPSTDGSLSAATAASAGATAALTGLVVVAIGLLSWIALQRARTLSPPLLSFALQRPG